MDRQTLGTLLFFLLCFFYASLVSAQPDIEIQAGESMLLPFNDVGRIAVGNSKVINAAAADSEGVLVFGKATGSSSLMIWSKKGDHKQFWIHVKAGESRRVQQELMAFFKRIPSVRVEAIGDKLIIEGDKVSDQDRSRIALLAKRYPQIIDFTNHLGWEKMVMMNVRVLEIPKTKIHELGVTWDPTSTGGFAAGISWDIGASASVWSRPGESPIDTAYPSRSLAGYLGTNMLWLAKIQAMEQNGDAILLASPQLSTRSGSTASFKAGGELPYGVVDKNGVSNTIFKPYGVSLDITPTVDHQGIIRSLIHVEVSSVDASVSTPSGPAVKTRKTDTEFNLSVGQTLVLSGFLNAEESREENAVPGLSKIPILGRFFRSERVQRKETELIVFVTPYVIDETQANQKKSVNQAREIIHGLNPSNELLPLEPSSYSELQADKNVLNHSSEHVDRVHSITESFEPIRSAPSKDNFYMERIWK